MFSARAIIPKSALFDVSKILKAVNNGLDAAAKGAEADFHTTTESWSDESKPDFKIVREEFLRRVTTDSAIYGYLNFGTSVRYAHMTPGYVPKTTPGFIGSGGGGGAVLFIDKSRPMPGIEPRDFEGAIQKKWDERLPGIIQRAIDSEVD